VAAYCAVPRDDPFAIPEAMFTALAAELSGPAAAGLTACELEDLLDERGREVIRQLLQDHYDLRTAREEQQAREQRAPAAGPGGITRTRLETGHGRLLATLFGTVRVTRCAWRKPGAGNWCPADAALSLPAGRHSHSLAKLAALEAARGSFEAAHAAIARRCGPVIGKRQLEQAVTAAAADIPAFCAARVPEPCPPPALVVLSADCKGIVMRPGALRAATAKAAARLGKMRTRLASGEKPNRNRMAALVTVYDAEPAKRRPHDVIAPPGGRHGGRRLRPGPKALAKWLAGSVRKDPAEVIATAFGEAEARDPGHPRTWVVLVEGGAHLVGGTVQLTGRVEHEVDLPQGVDDGGGPGDATAAEQRRGAFAGQFRDHLPGQARVLGVQELRADLLGDADDLLGDGARRLRDVQFVKFGHGRILVRNSRG